MKGILYIFATYPFSFCYLQFSGHLQLLALQSHIIDLLYSLLFLNLQNQYSHPLPRKVSEVPEGVHLAS